MLKGGPYGAKGGPYGAKGGGTLWCFYVRVTYNLRPVA